MATNEDHDVNDTGSGDCDGPDTNGMIINAIDGLPNVHPNYRDLPGAGHVVRMADDWAENDNLSQMQDGESDSGGRKRLEDLVSDEDLPTSLIVANLHPSVFKDEERRKELEAIFTQYGEPVTFQFFRSFRRMRVNYDCPAAAASARLNLHRVQVGESQINCYFAQPVSPIDGEDQHLHPPAPVRQFLISPPASPPVGWVPRDEAEPLVNYDLLAAIANLTPGETRELHPQTGGQPGIVVHVCEEGAVPKVVASDGAAVKPRLVQTRCPEHRRN
ncbi:calcipressin-2 [Ischnura elegans]|uniref:calcipressin-2 n=1 Tax=Ischnura elegans TaxID=197161 RepID=UPI001ED875AB|nr:calcipressin-2 [Ischnura elegans]